LPRHDGQKISPQYIFQKLCLKYQTDIVSKLTLPITRQLEVLYRWSWWKVTNANGSFEQKRN